MSGRVKGVVAQWRGIGGTSRVAVAALGLQARWGGGSTRSCTCSRVDIVGRWLGARAPVRLGRLFARRRAVTRVSAKDVAQVGSHDVFVEWGRKQVVYRQRESESTGWKTDRTTELLLSAIYIRDREASGFMMNITPSSRRVPKR